MQIDCAMAGHAGAIAHHCAGENIGAAEDSAADTAGQRFCLAHAEQEAKLHHQAGCAGLACSG